jgi:hypothetical protein
MLQHRFGGIAKSETAHDNIKIGSRKFSQSQPRGDPLRTAPIGVGR